MAKFCNIFLGVEDDLDWRAELRQQLIQDLMHLRVSFHIVRLTCLDMKDV